MKTIQSNVLVDNEKIRLFSVTYLDNVYAISENSALPVGQLHIGVSQMEWTISQLEHFFQGEGSVTFLTQNKRIRNY